MPDEQLIARTPAAPWLPDGSSAEVWGGTPCSVPDPCIIVRLLVVRDMYSEADEFFCVPTQRGLDLPTLFLGPGPDRLSPGDGLARLTEQILGRADVMAACIGYVRNVVPRADAVVYPHPTPLAHVPVFKVDRQTDPVVGGSWVTLDSARPGLGSRHWWPIVEDHLSSKSAR